MPEAPAPQGQERFFRHVLAVDMAELSKARRWMEDLGRAAGLPDARVFDLQVAVSEAAANAIEHASSEVEIAAWLLADRIIVEITNDGAFQPGLYKDADHRRRGMGLPLMVSLADQVHVARQPVGKTQVSLTFFLSGTNQRTTPAFSLDADSSGTRTTGDDHERPGVLGRWIWLAIPLLIAAVVVLHSLGPTSSYESPVLLATLNTLCLAAALLLMSFLAAQSFLLGGSRALWPMGWGALFLGLAYLLGGLLINRPNAAVTVSNVGILLAGACFLLSGVWALTETRRETESRRALWTVVVPSLGVIIFVGLLSAAALVGVLPEFFARGRGYSLWRTVILALGVLELLTAAGLFRALYQRRPSRFLRWCFSGLALIGVALAANLLTGAVPGSALAWLTRAGGWLGGVCLLVAILSVERAGGTWVLSLQKSLRESEDRYKNLVDLSPDGILVDADGAHVFANAAAARILGARSPGELIGRGMLQHVHPDDRELVAERASQVLAGALAPPREIRMIRLDGTIVEVEASGSRVEFDGQLANQMVLRDLTPRNDAERALRESQQDLSHAQRLAHTGSWRLKVESNELLWSAETYRMFGVPLGTPLTYELFLARVHPEDREFVDRAWSAALGGARYDLEHRIVAGDTVKWVHERAEFEFDEGGELSVAFGAVQDITQRRMAEEAQRRNEESLAQVLAAAGRLRLLERRRVWQVLLVGAALQVALIAGVSRLGSPSRYLGLPGAWAALVGVLAAILGGPVTGMAVAFVGGLAYFAFLTDFGRSVPPPTIAASIVLWILAAAGAGLAGDWIRHQATQRERALAHMLAERETLSDALGAANARLQEQHEELAAQHGALQEAQQETANLLDEQSTLFRRLQETLLDIPREIPGVEFAHLYRSATLHAQIGGDFYDVLEAKHGLIGVLIGDVCGHGVEAARTATLVKDTVHAFSHQFGRPHLVLRETNRLLLEKGIAGFVTAFLGFLDLKTGTLTYASAGHPPPFVAADGRVTPLEPGSSPLGLFADTRYRDSETHIPEGSLLLLYTDGVIEARRDGQIFGERRLADALGRMRDLPLERVPSLLFDESLHFSGGLLADDAALLVVSYRGDLADGPNASEVDRSEFSELGRREAARPGER